MPSQTRPGSPKVREKTAEGRHFIWHVFVLGNLESVSILMMMMIFLESWWMAYPFTRAAIYVGLSCSWAWPFRWWVKEWSERKEQLWLELGIGFSVRTTSPHFWGAREDGFWWKLMERGQEDLTEWNLSEGVELGCEVWLLCKGDHLRWGRRDLQVVKKIFWRTWVFAEWHLTGEKKGAGGDGVRVRVCVGVSSAPSVAKEHIS